MTPAAAKPFGWPGPRAREPFAQANRIQIAMLGGLFAMLAAFLGVGAIGFTALSGQLLDMQEQIGGVQVEVGKLSERVGNLETRITNVEARLTSVEARLTSVETILQIHHGPRPGS